MNSLGGSTRGNEYEKNMGEDKPLLEPWSVNNASGGESTKGTESGYDGSGKENLGEDEPLLEPYLINNDDRTSEDSGSLLISQEPIGHGGKGLTVVTAAVFIVGEIAGSGVLALPHAIDGTGWMGFILMLFCCLVSTYTGVYLGKSWVIVQDRHPEYRGHIRYPYPAIGYVTYGKAGRMLVSFSINFTLFGASVVYVLIASSNLQHLIRDLTKWDVSFCYWLIIVAGVLTPITWLGSPKDFWFIGLAAATATGIACVVITADFITQASNPLTVRHAVPSFTTFFSSFGIILWSFGGHPAFPTFQTDMKKQNKFGSSVGLAYIIILLMYIPVAFGGYFVLSSPVNSNSILEMSNGPMRYIVEILITVHLLFGLIIILNPVSQEIEEIFKVPNLFSWKRCVCRTAIVGCVLFMAETIPKFGPILSLVGGSTNTLLAYVLPPLFYMKLAKIEGGWPKIHIPLHHRTLMYEIMIVGLVGGVSVTYSAIASLFNDNTFTVPCFVNVTAAAG